MGSIINRYWEMGKKHPFLAVTMLLVLSGTAFGAWVLLMESEFTGSVVSTPPITMTSSFSDISVDTTSGPATATTELLIENANDVQNFVFVDEVIKTDVDDGCTDYENDCDVTYLLTNDRGDTLIVDGETVTIRPLDNTITATLECVEMSCPQDVDVSISLT